MNYYAAIANHADVAGGKFQRLPEYSMGENLIAFARESATLVKTADEIPAGTVLLVLAERLLKQSWAVDMLLGDAVKGVFVHPGRENRPGNAHTRRVVRGFPRAETLAACAVSFSVNGDKAYQVGALIDIWKWLSASVNDHPTTPPVLAIEQLREAYDRFWRRANIETLVPLAIYLQAMADPDVDRAVRDETAVEAGNELCPGHRAHWLLRQPDLTALCEAYLRARSSADWTDALEKSAALLLGVREFMSREAR